MKKKLFNGLLFAFLTVLIVELVLRFYGLHTPMLYISSDSYEYIYAPNQNLKRFQNRMITNQYSMRNKKINKNARIILGFGDSVLNGGSLTDHDSLATSKLNIRLNKNRKGDSIQVLNISAGSWGPDNCFSYLEEKGDFGAEVIFLVISSHDLKDNKIDNPKDGQIIPGNLKSFPIKNPNSAIEGLIRRYVIPDKQQGRNKKVNELLIHLAEKENSGFNDFINYSKKKNIRLLFYLHPTLREFKNKEYNNNGKRIIEIAKNNNIELISGLEYEVESGYRDAIHLNNKGQDILAKTLAPFLENAINTNNK